MSRVLALIGIVALMLFFRIPQRIPWDELRGFKGAADVEKAAQPLMEELMPKQSENALPKDPQPGMQDAAWMRSQCNKLLSSVARLSKADYQRHLSASDLKASDPLQDGTIQPFCIHEDASRVFIPDWLKERRYRLRLTQQGEDIVEQIAGGPGK